MFKKLRILFISLLLILFTGPTALAAITANYESSTNTVTITGTDTYTLTGTDSGMNAVLQLAANEDGSKYLLQTSMKGSNQISDKPSINGGNSYEFPMSSTTDSNPLTFNLVNCNPTVTNNLTGGNNSASFIQTRVKGNFLFKGSNSTITINGGNSESNKYTTGIQCGIVEDGSYTTTLDGLIFDVNSSGGQAKAYTCMGSGNNKNTIQNCQIDSENNGIFVDPQNAGEIVNCTITDCKITCNGFCVSTNGDCKGNPNIIIGENSVLTSTSDCALYLPCQGDQSIGGSQYTIQDNAKITGQTGINIRGGTLNIKGGTITANGESTTPMAVAGESQNSGAGVEISGTGGSSTGYGNVVVNVSGGTIISEKGNGIQQDNNNGSSTAINNTTNTLKSISITGGTLIGEKGSIQSNPPIVTGGQAGGGSSSSTADATGFISNGTFSPPLTSTDKNYIGTGAKTVTVKLPNGQEVQKFADKQEEIDQFLQEQPSGTEIIPSATEPPESLPSSNEASKIIALNLTANGTLQFYNINQTGTTTSAVNQSEDLNLTINTIGNAANTNVTPEYLNWSGASVTTPNGNSVKIPFPTQTAGGETKWVTYNTPTNLSYISGTNNVTTEYRRLYSDDNAWCLQYTKTTTVNNSNASSPKQTVTFSDLTLNYNGGEGYDSNPTGGTPQTYPDGVYSLTCTPVSGYQSSNLGSNSLESSIRFMINSSQTQKVEIVNMDGSTINTPVTVDLNSTRTAQYNYMRTIQNTNASNGTSQVLGGGNATWNLGIAGSTNNANSALPYASINPKTGVITFLKNPPTGTIFILSVNVDGILSNQVVIQTSGELTYDETTGIAPVYNPLNVNLGSNNNTYPTLNDNIVTTPIQGPVGAGSLTFTSSNTSFRPYTTGTSTTGPNTYQLIPMGSSTTGTTTITATWTNNGKTYTTEFDVNFVSSPVKATGINVSENLTFVMTDPVSQNVYASLLPTNNTVQANLLDGEGNGFTYESSDENIAVVDDFGNVTPVGPGTCTITTTADAKAQLPTGKNTATTTVTVNSEPETATAISIEPTTIYLVPDGTEGTTSADITATLTPENVDPSTVTWTASSDGITLSETSGLTTTVSSTDESGTYTVTASVPGENDEEITATATVIVADTPLVIDPAKSTITADSPDYYTVTVAPIANEALEGDSSATPQRVSIFTWSQLGQTDLDCKVAEKNANGTYSYTFPVNDTPDNNYYLDASNIIVQAYASTDPNTDGQMVMNTTWNYADCGWDSNVIATAYVQNEGFVKPSVGANTTAGTTGQGLQMEGIRLSTPIEGVDLVYDVHVQNIGWMDQVTEGYYAGTMHQNLQVEAIHVKLTGSNASDYTVQYQAHVQDIGWQNWVADGAEAGTTGQGLQMEALKIQVVPKGTALPTN